MQKNITITPKAPVCVLLTVLFAVMVLLVVRTAKNALAGLETARHWLYDSHEFYAQDGDPVRCTGWQFVGYNLAALAVALLLSIRY